MYGDSDDDNRRDLAWYGGIRILSRTRLIDRFQSNWTFLAFDICKISG